MTLKPANPFTFVPVMMELVSPLDRQACPAAAARLAPHASLMQLHWPEETSIGTSNVSLADSQISSSLVVVVLPRRQSVMWCSRRLHRDPGLLVKGP